MQNLHYSVIFCILCIWINLRLQIRKLNLLSTKLLSKSSVALDRDHVCMRRHNMRVPPCGVRSVTKDFHVKDGLTHDKIRNVSLFKIIFIMSFLVSAIESLRYC